MVLVNLIKGSPQSDRRKCFDHELMTSALSALVASIVYSNRLGFQLRPVIDLSLQPDCAPIKAARWAALSASQATNNCGAAALIFASDVLSLVVGPNVR